MEYDIVIGLEVHAELSTETKMYCGCKNVFGARANLNCCEICLGMPGTLPTINKKAIEYAIKAGLAFNCDINKRTSLARKNYFYPDLPKSYQISQNALPLCLNGYIEILLNEGKSKKKINLRQIHIEEDTGKLIHDATTNTTLVDYNRGGIPLIEIISMPELNNAYEVKACLETIKDVLVSLGISDCRMQEGSMRCDINVSLKPRGSKVLGTRCEIKNVGSFSGAFKATEREIERQKKLLASGNSIDQITMYWDETKNDNIVMREKEKATDYRYFEEPDLPIIEICNSEVERIRATISELPNSKLLRFVFDYNIPYADACSLVSNIEKCNIFEETVKISNCNAKKISNWILGDISKILNEQNIELSKTKLTAQKLKELIELIEEGRVSSTAGKTILEVVMKEEISIEEVIKKENLEQISDEKLLEKIAREVLENNPQVKELYNKGKTNILGFAVGQCMKISKGKGNPAMFQKIISNLIVGE